MYLGGNYLKHSITIKELSKKTGIAPSAIRFYETKGLIRSNRNTSGYRVYEDDQIEMLKLIASLRLINVPLKDIQSYLLEKDNFRKHEMVTVWKSNLEKQRKLLDVSYRFLDSNSLNEPIYLKEKSEEVIIWFDSEGEVGEFGEHIKAKAKLLKRRNITFENCYFRYLSGDHFLKVRIGFVIDSKVDLEQIERPFTIEIMQPCIVLALPFKEPIKMVKSGYLKLLGYANENEWIPVGSIMECYYGNDFMEMEIILPVFHLEEEERK